MQGQGRVHRLAGRRGHGQRRERSVTGTGRGRQLCSIPRQHADQTLRRKDQFLSQSYKTSKGLEIYTCSVSST